jgi:predicted metalloprotease with PDZ domain
MQSRSRFYYEVDFHQAARHIAEGSHACRLIFPVWTPGSYMIREYTRNIERLSATCHQQFHGPVHETVEPHRIGKNVWEFDAEEVDWLKVHYQLYCRELSVRTNWLESDFGFLTGAAAFPFVEGYEDRPIEMRMQLPEQWRSIATSLCRLEPDVDVERYQAETFDELVDSPIALGDFPVRSFCVGGKPHYLANVGDRQNWDLDRAIADLERIVDEEQRFWGEIPYEDYWFINLLTESGGGLEHDNSTVLMTSRWAMQKRDSYLNWLALVSHEFFHTWNVRRLRPKVLLSYDYQQEQFFKELWIAEGITSYFDDLMLVWAGLCTREEYLARLSKNIQAVQAAPGRLVQPLDQSSWDAWIKHYRPDENSQNARISYYLKGALVAWLLDSQLRRSSGGVHTLGNLMRQLWQEFRHTGYTLADFERMVELRCGSELRDWLHEQVCEAKELDFTEALRYFGLRFKSSNGKKEAATEKLVSEVWIGSDSTATDGRLYVRRVYRGSPSDNAGLNVDDELIALDGYRLTPEAWPDRLNMYLPGDSLELLVARRGQLKRLTICMGQRNSQTWQLELDPAATMAAKSNLDRWLSRQVESSQLATA